MKRIAIFLCLLSIPFFAFAQERPAGEPYEPFIPQEGDANTQNKLDEAFTSCFDYYRFGSTPIIISSELSTVAQGSTVGFKGKITNENEYPLTDVAIYAKMFYRANPSAKDSFGPEVVDFFKVADGVTLKAGETQELNLTWNVPQDANLGEYQLATFVVDHDRFNMLGLSFSTDIVGGSAKFAVVGAPVGNTGFDIHKTTVGSEILHAATFAPRVEVGDEGLPITLHLVNTTPQKAEGTVTFTLYAWDTIREENIIDSSEMEISVNAGEDLPLTYIVTDDSQSVYDLLVEYTPRDANLQRSIQAIRFLNSDVQTPRINFVGADAFPGEKDSTAFVCVHSTGTKDSQNVRVELTATSNSILDLITFRSALAKKTYEGPVHGSINALTAPFAHASDAFTVRAKVYQGDALVDDVSVVYSCSASAEGCAQPMLLIGIALLIVILGGGWLYTKRKKVSLNSPTV